MICRDNLGQPDAVAVGMVDVNFTEFVRVAQPRGGDPDGIRTPSLHKENEVPAFQ